MKVATRYVADDGSEWVSEADAKARDELIREVADIMLKLPKPPERALDGGKAYSTECSIISEPTSIGSCGLGFCMADFSTRRFFRQQ